MLELALVLWGAGAAALGWYWAGVTEGRTTWVPLAGTSIVLAGITVFGEAELPVWAFTAVSAVAFGLLAAEVGWGVVSDATLGFGGLFYATAAGLSTAGIANAADEFTIQSLGTLIAAIAGALVFISAALAAPSAVFRRVLGWGIVIAGFGVAFIGYANSIDVSF